MKENLLLVARDFVRRSRTHSQAEDFFTEVLAALLRLSSDFREGFLALVLEDSTQEATGLPVWQIRTQEEVEVDEATYGVPDLVLKGGKSEDASPSHLIAIEVKLDATLDTDQLAKYDAWLQEKQGDYDLVSLSALTTSERARSAAQQASSDLEHWSSWVRWAQVEEILSSHLDHDARAGDWASDSANGQRLFHVYGDAFASLLADEGLVPPSPLQPSQDASLLQGTASGDVQSRHINLSHLLHQALRDSGVLRVLTDQNPRWRPMRARDGLPHRTQHHKGVQLRQRFQPGSFRGVVFSFGLAYYVRGWLLRDDESPHALEHLNLAGALEVWDDRGSKEANQLSLVLSGERQVVPPVKELCEELNAVAKLNEEIFVPSTNYRWAKFVCRRSAEDLVGTTKDEQKAEIGKFFSGFINAFGDVSGESLGYPDVTLLHGMGKLLESSSV